jgi:hypothetical protein
MAAAIASLAIAIGFTFVLYYVFWSPKSLQN